MDRDVLNLLDRAVERRIARVDPRLEEVAPLEPFAVETLSDTVVTRKVEIDDAALARRRILLLLRR